MAQWLTNLLFKKIPLLILIVFSVPLFAQDSLTLDRPNNIVVLKGGDLPGLVGSAVEEVHLYRFSGGVWVPVPFQIDELLPERDVCETDIGHVAVPATAERQRRDDQRGSRKCSAADFCA